MTREAHRRCERSLEPHPDVPAGRGEHDLGLKAVPARAERPDRVDALDAEVVTEVALGGLDVRHLLGVGGSQSAGRLATYINAVDPLVSRTVLTGMQEGYLQGADPTDRRASPLFADLAGLPPLLVQVGSAELLLSDSERLASAAAEAGVDITLHVGEGLPHVYQAAVATPEAESAMRQIADFIRRL